MTIAYAIITFDWEFPGVHWQPLTPTRKPSDSRPGKPADNVFIESFNGKLRTECLNQNWFLSLADARDKIGAWW